MDKDLSPFEVLEFEPVTEYVQRLFAKYQLVREKMLKWYARYSEQRVKLANRFRRPRDIRVGMKVVYRDPRVRAAGGRRPWKQPLTEPLTVVAVDGNKLHVRRSDGTDVVNAHIEYCVTVQDNAQAYERDELTGAAAGVTAPDIPT